MQYKVNVHHAKTKGVYMSKRVSISLDTEQARLLDSLYGLGKKDAEKVKNILIAYLSEKGFIEQFNKRVRKS